MKEVILELLRSNPGIGTVALSAFVLPLAVLWITNRHTRRLKRIEHENDLKRAQFDKDLEGTTSEKRLKADHERLVHASLVKILFDVQKLHIALSGKCVDYKCLDEAVDKFQLSFSRYQEAIADNQLFLSSKVTNLLYRFYQLLGQLLVELKDLKDSKQFDLSVVAVYSSSQQLADSVIVIQDEFNSHRKAVEERFAQADLSNFRQCCGQPPPNYLQERYDRAKEKLESLPNEREGDFSPRTSGVNSN